MANEACYDRGTSIFETNFSQVTGLLNITTR